MRPTKFEVRFTGELMLSRGGWPLAGQLLGLTRLGERMSQLQLGGPRKGRPVIGHGDVVLAMIGLLCLGKPDFAAIEDEAGEELLAESLGLGHVASEATLRQRLDELGALQLSEAKAIVREESSAMVLAAAPTLRPIAGGKSGATAGGLVPLDIDVSPFDNSNTKKEGVSYTYKGMDGYAPILAYYGQEGYLLDAELREGSQHSQKGFVEFLGPCLDSAESLRMKLAPKAVTLVRLDSGHDAADTIHALQLVRRRQPLHWLVKANLRGKNREELLEMAQAHGEASHPRDGKTVWVADSFLERDGRLHRVVIEAIERTIDADGQALLLPDVEINFWWTSLPRTKFSAARIIELYHDHGTSEQFHSELKTDMNLERLPSGKFNTNALLLSLAVVAYNLLRLLERRSLDDDAQLPPSSRPRMKRDARGRPRVKRRRLGTIVQDLMYLAVKLVRSGRRVGLRLCRAHRWSHVWHTLYTGLAARRCAPAP